MDVYILILGHLFETNDPFICSFSSSLEELNFDLYWLQKSIKTYMQGNL